MNKNAIIAIISTVLIFSLFIFTRPPTNNCQANPCRVLNPKTIIYDVRTKAEYQAGHVEKAILWPIEDIKAGKLPPISRKTPIAVYCRSGNRSGIAAKILKQSNYSNVTDLGGLTNLPNYNLKLTK